MKKKPPSRRPGRTSPSKSAPRTAKGTLLLVDDDESARKNMAKVLDRKGWTVLVAGDGEEALALSVGFKGPIHLLITDVMMPVMNGKDLAERLCAMRPEILVLFVSGYAKEEVLSENGCGDREHWLGKPFTGTQLGAKVKAILASAR